MPRQNQEKNVKYLIINGLPRSGTTMMERLIDSQPLSVCFAGLFAMPQFISEIKGLVDRFSVLGADFSEPHLMLGDKDAEIFKRKVVADLSATMMRFGEYRSYKIGDPENMTLYGYTWDDYCRVLHAIVHEPDLIHKNLLSFFPHESHGLSLIATKLTACHSYAPQFVEHDDCYWLEVVRNPKDRFVSASLFHEDSLFSIVSQSDNNLSFASKFEHPRYKAVTYEDLCEKPEANMAALSEWLGVELKDYPLTNPYGQPFKPNSSQNVTKGRDYDYQDEQAPSVVGSLNQSWKGQYVTAYQEALISALIHPNEFYELPRPKPVLALRAHLHIMMRGLLRNLWRTAAHVAKRIRP